MLTQLYMVLFVHELHMWKPVGQSQLPLRGNSESGGNTLLHSNFKKIFLVESRAIGLVRLAQ
jgi:hypothetical protein